MRWIRRSRREGVNLVRSPERQAARAALGRARAARAAAEAVQPQVEDMARRLRELREENHFAEMIRSALGGG